MVCAWLDRCAFECDHVCFLFQSEYLPCSSGVLCPCLPLWAAVTLWREDLWAATSLGVRRERKGRPVFEFAVLDDPRLRHSVLHPAFCLTSEPLPRPPSFCLSPQRLEAGPEVKGSAPLTSCMQLS